MFRGSFASAANTQVVSKALAICRSAFFRFVDFDICENIFLKISVFSLVDSGFFRSMSDVWGPKRSGSVSSVTAK